MVWGILEVPLSEKVPGTVVIGEHTDQPSEYAHIPPELLRHGEGKYANLVLSPQPSASPNDPLNWPTWRKDLVLVITGMSAAVVGAFGPMLSPGFVVISESLGITVEILSQSTAWLILTIGISLFILNPIAKKSGRRPVFLLSSAIMLSASIWGGVAKDYNSFLASRIWSGLGMAPYEVLVQVTIADMYFVHQRATRIAVWNMFLLCGIAGGGLISGYIIENQGWQWMFIWCAIFFGVLLPLVFLFVPETAYVRPSLEDRFAGYALRQSSEKAKADVDVSAVEEAAETVTATEKKHTFVQSLRVFTGPYSSTPLLRIFLRPMIVFFYPSVFWAFLMYGTTLTWIVVFSVVNASIFTVPPYNFSVSQTGLISLSPFILTLVGELMSGPLVDRVAVALTRRNNGVYEPEFRLPPLVFALVIGAAGFYGFGASVHFQTHWSGPVLCFGLANMALAWLNSSVFPYVLDAHGDISEEAFVAINARNFLTFGLTYFVNNWLAKSGVLSVFSILGSIYVVVMLSTVLLWVYGKRARHFIACNEFLKNFMHED